MRKNNEVNRERKIRIYLKFKYNVSDEGVYIYTGFL